MPDREKVIEALRICRENLSTKSCRKCPYMRGRDGTGTCYPIDAKENGVHLCWQDLVDDAIALLKEQEPVKPDEVFVNNPSPEPDQWLFICPICTNDVEKGDHYCKHCGRELKWDD